jgi:hypothetical protein
MILTSNTRLTDRIAEWLGRRLARYLARPVKDFVPLATADPGAFLRALRPGDIRSCRGQHPRLDGDQISHAMDLVPFVALCRADFRSERTLG